MPLQSFTGLLILKKIVIAVIFAFILGAGLTYAYLRTTHQKQEQTAIYPTIFEESTTSIIQPTVPLVIDTSRSACQTDAECFLTYYEDCMSNKYIGCGIEDYADESVQAYSIKLCTPKDPHQAVPGCQTQSLNENLYEAMCIDNTCKKILKLEISPPENSAQCTSSADCPPTSSCVYPSEHCWVFQCINSQCVEADTTVQ